uniref:Rab-GAP TBC domain-containing protein n=1 Tax=Astyanax mexicanus TaxID=7994 RepID=A0A8B9HTQ8_ASTMX
MSQVADEKSCMQFSIRRPTLPSTETHPEERLYRRLDVSSWLRHLNHSGQVEEEYKLRKAIFFGGIDPSIRGEVWPFLLHYYSYDSTSEEREAWRLQKRSVCVRPHENGIVKSLKVKLTLSLSMFQMYLRELLRLMLPRFHQHLMRLGEDGLQLLFCHRWVLLCFKREFPDMEALRMWEACWAHYQVQL